MWPCISYSGVVHIFGNEEHSTKYGASSIVALSSSHRNIIRSNRQFKNENGGCY